MKNSLKNKKGKNINDNTDESMNELLFEKAINKVDWHIKRAFSNFNKFDQLEQWKEIMDLKKDAFGTDMAFVFKDETSWNELNKNIVKISNERFLYSIFKYLCNYLPADELNRVEHAVLSIDEKVDNFISKNLIYKLCSIKDQNSVLLKEIEDNVHNILLTAYKKIDKLEKDLEVLKAKNKRSYDQTNDAFVDVIINYIKSKLSYPDMSIIESIFSGQSINQLKKILKSNTFKTTFLTRLTKLIIYTEKGIKKNNSQTPQQTRIKNDESNSKTRNKILTYIEIYNSKASEWHLPSYND